MDSRDQRRPTRLICLLLVLGTLAVFGQTVFHGFVAFDDPDYVTKNSHVQAGLTLDGLIWAFRTGHACNWHPVTWVSHMIDCQLHDVQPAGHHFTNLLLHIANVLLLFGLLRQMTGALWRSAIVAALFAWHPLHVESVAWISERKDVLSTFFWLLTTWAYLRYVKEKADSKRQARRWYLWSLLFFALGLMSKPMLVTLPFVLLLLDYWPLKRFELSTLNSQLSTLFRLFAEKLPFFLLAAVSSVVTFMVQKRGGAVATMESLPPSLRVANAVIAYFRYLGKTFWPDNLAVFYPIQAPRPAWQVMAAAVLLLAVAGLAVAQRRQRPWLLVGWFWFLGTLVPVIGLVQVGSQAIADRYTYIPLIGFFIMLVWELAERLPANRKFAGAVATIVLVVCLALATKQTTYWRNDLALFGHALDVTTNNAVAEVNYGLALSESGHPDEAMDHFNTALRLKPRSPVTIYNIGLLHARTGDADLAAQYYYRALSIDPNFSDAHYNLGNLFAAQNKPAEAAKEYAASIKGEPDSADAHNNLGAMLARLGSLEEAMTEFKTALRIKPNFPEAQDQLGGVLLKLNSLDEARIHYAEAVRLKPDFFHAQLKLGSVLARQAQFPEAQIHLAKAVELEPTNAVARFNLAGVCEALGELGHAAEGFAQAVRLQPDDAANHQRLAVALAKLGKFKDAADQYREALRLKPDFAEALKGLNELQSTNPAVRQMKNSMPPSPAH